jgi:hypothetical protein
MLSIKNNSYVSQQSLGMAYLLRHKTLQMIQMHINHLRKSRLHCFIHKWYVFKDKMALSNRIYKPQKETKTSSDVPNINLCSCKHIFILATHSLRILVLLYSSGPVTPFFPLNADCYLGIAMGHARCFTNQHRCMIYMPPLLSWHCSLSRIITWFLTL